MPRPDDPSPPTPVSRRKFLVQVAAAAATAPALSALAGAVEAAPHHAPKHAPPAPHPAKPEPAPTGGPGAHPDWSVAKTPAEREALEKQWKQMVELVAALRKTPVPVGTEFATGALAPRRLRREAN